MKPSNKNRNKLVAARPKPLALEARIMFDGAAVETALLAARAAEAAMQEPPTEGSSASTEPHDAIPAAAGKISNAPVLAADRSPGEPGDGLQPGGLFEADAATPQLQDALAQTERTLRDFIAAHPDDAALFELFSGRQETPSQARLDKAGALRQDIIDGRYSIAVREIGNNEIGGVFGVFALGQQGETVIFLNRDWLATNPSTDTLSRVLIEEFGHSLDRALNGNHDTAGDEGEAFASAVLGFALSDAERSRIAAENDASRIYVDGVAYDVEQAALTFSAVYRGTPSAWSEEANQIANVAAIAGSNFKFTSLDPNAPYFSGNNVSGVLSYIDGNGQTQSISGVVSRLIKSGSTVEGLYFYVWGNTVAVGDGGAGGDAAEAAYVLCLDSSKFTSGGTYRTSSDPVDTAMNRFIVPNSAPVGVNDTVTVPEGGSISHNVLANDTDANNDTLTLTGFKIGGVTGQLGVAQTIAGVGSFALNANGSYTFTPAADYTGTAPVITYTVSDGKTSSSSNLTITIAPVNDSPVGTSTAVTMPGDTSYTFSATDFGFSDANDTPANSFYSVTITSLPLKGSLTLNGVAVSAGQEVLVADLTKLKYAPAQYGSGANYASFTFQVRDNGGTANGGVDLDPVARTFTFNVTAVNHAPVANPDSATAREAGGVANGTAGTAPSGNVLDNDTEHDAGDSKAVASTGSAMQGATVVGDGTEITGIYGTLTISADGSYTYTLDNNNAAVQALRTSADTLAETFTYTMKDAAGLESSSTLTVTIEGANDAPVARNDFNLAVSSNVTAGKINPNGNVLTNDTDADHGDSRTVTQASKGQALGDSPTDIGLGTVVEGTEGRTYLSFDTQGAGNLKVGDAVTGTGVPAGTTVASVANVSGIRTVTFTNRVALDWATLGTSTLTVGGNNYTIDSRGAPDANVIAISSATGGTISAGMAVTGTGIQSGTTVSSVSTVGAYSFVTLSQAVSGALGTNVVFGAGGTTINGDHGTLLLKQDGSYAYTVTSNALVSGSAPYYDHFTYKVQDAAGASSTAVLTIRIDVSNVAPPSAAADANSITENSASVSVLAAAGVLTNDSGTSKSVSSAWAANDSAMTTVTGGGISLTGLYGTLTISSDGSYSYALDNNNPSVDALQAGQTLSDEFRYRMTDSGGGYAVSTLNITINGANDAPSATGDTAVALESGGVNNGAAGHNPTGNVLANDSDPEGAALTVSAISGGTVGQAMAGSYGSLLLNADGSYAYTVDNGNASVQALNAGQTLTDTFTYTVSDNSGGTATASLTVTIHGANDAPINTLSGAAPTIAENASGAIGGISVADVDDASLTVQLSVQNGTLSIGDLRGAAIAAGSNDSLTLTLSGTKTQLNDALATLRYQGDIDFSGTDRLLLQTTDSCGLTDVSALAITVTPDARPLTVAGTIVNEASPYAFFSVGGAADQKVLLALDVTGAGAGHAEGGMDYSPGFEYFNGSGWTYYHGEAVTVPGNGTLLVRVAVLNDNAYEGAETFRLTATNKAGTPSAANSTIRDDGTGSIFLGTNTSGIANASTDNGYPSHLDDDRTLSVNNISVNEASPYAVFSVTGRTGQTISLALSGATATIGADTGTGIQYHNGSQWQNYSGGPLTLTAPTLLVRVTIVPDDVYEGMETFGLVAANLGGGLPALGIASIHDDGTGTVYTGTVIDGAPDTDASGLDDDRVLSVSEPVVNEGSDWAVFTVTGNAGEAVSLHLLNDSANGSVTGKANIDAGQTIQFWNGSQWEDYDGGNLPAIQSGNSLLVRADITQEQDSEYEGAETFRLTARYVSGDTSRSATGTATIRDDATGTKYPGTVINGAPDDSDDGLDDDRVPDPVNNAPATADVSASGNEDSLIAVTLSGSDADGTVTGYVIGTLPANGKLYSDAAGTSEVQAGDIVTGPVYFLGNGNWNGSTSFTYVARDNEGAVDASPATVSITVNPVNDAPTASGTAISTNEDSAISGTLPAASDADGETVSYAKATDPGNGSVTVNGDGTYTYTPNPDYHGPDSFTYTVSDGNGDSHTYTVSITVLPLNDMPDAAADTLTTAEDTALVIEPSTLLANDTDAEGNTLVIQSVQDASNGTVAIVNGKIVFTPAADFNGVASFTYTVSDGQGGTDTATVTVNVTAVNDVPNATNASITTDEDTPAGGILPAASDADGDIVIYAKLTDPAHGTVVVNADGSYVYTPATDYHGSDSFSYTVSDGNGGSNTYTVNLTVNPVNDAPVASTVAPGSAAVGLPMTPLSIPAFTDIDNDTLTYNASLDNGDPLPSWLSFDPATRTFTGTPPAGAAGSYALLVIGSDGALSDGARIVFTVENPAASAPTVSIVSMTRDTGASASDFITADGAANRTVAGTISAPLGPNEAVQVSFDSGLTWHAATTFSTGWTIVDPSSHGADWIIQARVVNTAANLAGASASQDVTLDTAAPAAPTVDSTTTMSTKPVLGGTAAISAGETLRITVNGASYDVVPSGGRWTLDLASASPVAGTPAPLLPGRTYDVVATISDRAGNAASDRTSGELTIGVPPVPAPAPAPLPPEPPRPTLAPLPAPVAPAVEPRPVETPSMAPGSMASGDSARLGSGIGITRMDAAEMQIRRGAELSDIYTRSEGFRTVVAKAEEPALVLFQGVPDQYIESGRHLSLTVPADAFAHTQPKEVVRLAASLQDGRPLPEWVQFNAQTGQFSAEVPEGMVGELRIKVVARDMAGREATALFRVNVGTVKAGAGKIGLSDQLRQSGMPYQARDGGPTALNRPASNMRSRV